MKTVQALMIVLMAYVTAPAPVWALNIGDPIPNEAKTFKLIAPDKTETSLAQLKGEKGTLVIFTCNKCPYAVKWQERIADIGNSFAKSFAVVAVNSNDLNREGESLGHMQRRAEFLKLQFPYLADDQSALATAFGATVTPEAFLFDSKGVLTYHGAIDDNAGNPKEVKEHYLRDALTALEQGKQPAKAEAKAVGCGIKKWPNAKK